MKRWVLAGMMAVLGVACAAPERTSLDIGESEAALTSAELVEQELQQAFDDAACYCEAYLLIPALSSPLIASDLKPELASPPTSTSSQLYDARLRAYADHHSANGQRLACGFSKNAQGAYTLTPGQGLSTASPHGALPVRELKTQAALDAELGNNGCLSNKSGWSASRGPESTNDSFCRADLNYCIAQELRAKADSLARAPTTRAARDAILAEARARYALAGDVYATAFSDVGLDHCGPGVSPPSYGGVCKAYQSCADISFGYDVVGYYETKTYDHALCIEVCGTGKKPTCTIKCNSECATYTTQRRDALRAAIPESAKATDGTPLRDQVKISGKPSDNVCTITGTRPVIRTKAAPPCACNESVYQDAASCERLKTSFGDRVLARAAQSAAQVGELATLEATSRMAASDSVPAASPNDPVTYGARVWGPGSQRDAAVRALVGNPASSVSAQQPYANNLQLDASGVRALALLEEFSVVLPYEICASGSSGWLALSDDDATAFRLQMLTDLGEQALNVLDLPLDQPPLDLVRNELGIDEGDIEAALVLLKDRLATFDVDYQLVGVEPSPQHADCQLAAFKLGRDGIEPRSSLPYVASLAQTGGALAQMFAEGWFKASTSAVSALGAAQQLHLLRKTLTQLANRHSFTGARASRVQDAVRLIDGFAGPAWTDWQMTCFYGCSGSWRATGTSLTTASKLGLATEADAACLVHDHVSGSDKPCASDAFMPVTLSQPSSAFQWTTRPSVTFGMNDVTLGQRWYVIEKRCAEDGVSCRHVVLDVIDTSVDDAVHTFGGAFGSLLDRLLAKNPDNPAEPLHNALGLKNGDVPSMSVGFSGTVLDNWYDHYALSATGEVQDVKKRLDAAYQQELEILVQDKKTSFDQASIALAQQAVVEKACGNATGDNCSSPRIAQIKLSDLGLVPAPGSDPGGAENGQSCTQFLQTFHFSVPSSGIKDYVSKNLKAALRCTRWATLVLASEATLRDVPESVRTQLIQGAEKGLFPEVGGEVAAQYLTLFEQLRDFRVALRQFDTASQIANARLDNALTKIKEDEKTWWDKFSCYSTSILKSTAVLAGVAAAIAASPATGGASGTGVLIAVAAYADHAGSVVSAVDNLVSVSDCSDNSAAQSGAREAFAQVLAALDEMRLLGDNAQKLIAGARRADIALHTIDADVAIATARNRLESDMLTLGASFDPATRFAQSLNVRDASMYLAEAQRGLFKARRAIEFRAAEDLRWVNDAAAFSYGSPHTWVNEVFALDFPNTPVSGGRGAAVVSALDLHAKRIYSLVADDDYQNYRPFKLGHAARVLRLSEVLAAQRLGDGDEPFWKQLSFACRQGSLGFLPGGHAPGDDPESLPCAKRGGVAKARVTFDVPTPYYGYFRGAFELGSEGNYRIASTAVNLVGSALHRCFNGSTPQLCEDNRDVPYELRQSNRVWLESLVRELRSYELQPGVVTADALASDEVITSSNLDRIKAYEQTQLNDRPLAGTMTLTLSSPAGRDIAFENLDDIQLVVRYEFWTPQE